MLSKRLVTLALVMICFPLLLCLLNVSPEIAIRAYLFETGHPIVAFTATITEDKFENTINNEGFNKTNCERYVLSKKFEDWGSGNFVFNVKVTKWWFIYLAEGSGEA